MDISIIIPTYNREKEIKTVINSLQSLIDRCTKDDIEVIFVDDFSTDDTTRIIREVTKFEYRIVELGTNSGSPSYPRNVGINEATGEYVYFLDSDDEIHVSGFYKIIRQIEKEKPEVIRTALFRKENDKIEKYNILNLENNTINELLVRSSLITSAGLIKREILLKNDIKFDVNRKVGEDVIFWLECIKYSKKISISNECAYIYNFEIAENSSTQNITLKEIEDMVSLWEILDETFEKYGIDYFSTKAKVNFEYLMTQISITNINEMDEVLFSKISNFFAKTLFVYDNEKLNSLYESIRENDREGTKKNLRLNLLVAGYELKFIDFYYPYLAEHFNILVDEWQGHEKHDEEKSRDLLQMADIILCEWMVGNAVWYSKNVLPHQKLYLRGHRFEAHTKYMKEIDFDQVEKIITIAYHYTEHFIEASGIERSKFLLIHNGIEIDKYKKKENINYTIGMIGYVPSRKGFQKALRIVKGVHKVIPSINFVVYGKKPEELSWVACDKKEITYFEKATEYIIENKLDEVVKIAGFGNMKEKCAEIDFVLSTSEDEGSHVAVSDAFASNSCSMILKWPGSEYVYPEKYIFETEQEIIDKIISIYKEDNYFEYNNYGVDFLKKYDINKIVEELTSLWR